MIVTDKKLENSRVELQIEVSQTDVDNEYTKVFNQIQKRAKVDGFRQGRVPMDIIIKKFKSSADSEVAENIVKESYVNAVTEKELNPISQPEFQLDPIEKDKSYKFSVQFDVAPTVELGNYKNLSAKEKSCKITDADVDNEIQSLRERYATVTKKEKGEKAESGNYVRAETRRIDNVEPDEIEKVPSSNISVVIGKDKSNVGFDDDIIGMMVDEQKEIIKKYPKDYADKEVAGQKVKYQLKIVEISSLALPDLDDEFAKDLGDFSTIEDVKNKIGEDLKKFVEEKASRDVKNELLKNIMENSKFDIPESMIEREADNIMDKFLSNMGVDRSKINELMEKGTINREQFIPTIRQDAINNIKTTLVLLEIAKAENLKVPEDQYKEILNSYAEKNNTTIEDIEKKLEETGMKGNVETELIINSASDFLYSNSNIKVEKPVSYKDFSGTGSA